MRPANYEKNCSYNQSAVQLAILLSAVPGIARQSSPAQVSGRAPALPLKVGFR